MKPIKPVQNLIDELQKFPSIGPKTAARLTYWLLKAPREVSENLAKALLELKDKTVICEVCFNVADSNPCSICSDSNRDHSKICVVEEPLDVVAIEKTGKYNGLYHVLGGAISPVDGIGPEELRIAELLKRVKDNQMIRESDDQGIRESENRRKSSHPVIRSSSYPIEVILTTNPTMEGEATAMYVKKRISELANKRIRITRIARGLPTGGDLEYADETTISKALEGRREY